MSSRQRLEVWNGTRKKTSGGLTKQDLIKNKRGKLVSKRKSEQAADKNNLGAFLRASGAKMKKNEMLHKKGAAAPESKPAPKPAKAAPKPAPKKAAPKAAPKKAAPKKAAPKKTAPKKSAAKAAAPKKAAPKKVVRAEAKYVKKGKINPLTKQPYEKKSGAFVEDAKISLDNVKRRKLRPKKKTHTVWF